MCTVHAAPVQLSHLYIVTVTGSGRLCPVCLFTGTNGFKGPGNVTVTRTWDKLDSKATQQEKLNGLWCHAAMNKNPQTPSLCIVRFNTEIFQEHSKTA